jgi:hypothetical protein
LNSKILLIQNKIENGICSVKTWKSIKPRIIKTTKTSIVSALAKCDNNCGAQQLNAGDAANEPKSSEHCSFKFKAKEKFGERSKRVQHWTDH